MTETKFFEIRDEGTHVPMMCTRISSTADDPPPYPMCRAGFRPYRDVFLLTSLVTMETQYDPSKWSNRRTFFNAHVAIMLDWATLHDNDVIDVEFFLGETTTKKVSERYHPTEAL